MKEDLTRGPDELKSRWYRHFRKVLNTPSQCQEEAIANLPSLPVQWDLDSPPIAEEFESVVSKSKRGKAGGRTGVLPELILCGGVELWDRLTELIRKVREEESVVKVQK